MSRRSVHHLLSYTEEPTPAWLELRRSFFCVCRGCGCAHPGLHLWRSEVNVRRLPLLLSILFFKIGYWLILELSVASKLADQRAPRLLLSPSSPPVLGLQTLLRPAFTWVPQIGTQLPETVKQSILRTKPLPSLVQCLLLRTSLPPALRKLCEWHTS